MQQNNRCHECQKLWGEYVSALFQHATVDRQLYFVSIGEEPGSITVLTSALVAAAIAKDSMRDLIRKHQETHRKVETAYA